MEIEKKLLISRRFLIAALVIGLVLFNYGQWIFDHVSKYVGAVQVNIDIDTAINGTSHFQTSSQTVFIDDQTGYKFFRDAPGYCVYRKTTDGGLTWSATTTVDSQTDCVQITVWYDKWTPNSASSSIHIATLDTGIGDVFYKHLDPSTDTLSPVGTTTDTSMTQGGSIVEGVNTTSITRGTDGTLYVSMIDNTDSFVMECTTNCTASTSWTETGVGTSTFGLGATPDSMILMPLTSGDIMAIIRRVSLEDMISKTWINTTATWTATTTFDSNAPDNTTYDVGMAATLSSTSPGVIYLAYAASNTTPGTDDEVRAAKYNGSTWATTTDVLTATARGLTNVAIGLNAANDDVYVAYSGRTTAGNAATGNVYLKWATSSMANWSVERGPYNTAANDIYGVDINRVSDQRLYASWFVNTGDDILGDTIEDIHPGINATTTGTQVTSLPASSTSQYVGGAFVITQTYKTNDVTGVTITENGTIDAENYLRNIKLMYDMDTTAPYDCASVSYNGDELQFGATTTGGFSAANGSTTITGTTVTVSTTTALCLYPVMDILFLATTTPSTTLEIYINNPTTDITVTGGTAGPAVLENISGTTVVYNTNPTQTHYHWRSDNGDEAWAVSATGAQDTIFSKIAQKLPYRLRFQVSNEGGTTTTNYQYRIEYALKTTACSTTASWTDVGAADGDWDMIGSKLTDGGNTTNIGSTATGSMTDENTTFLAANGAQEELSSQTGNITLATNQFVELEYAIQATASSTEGATYCFRVTNAGIPLPTYLQYAEGTVKYPSDFRVQRGSTTITGASATLTAGVDYIAPAASTSAFIRITNTQFTGAGDNLATASQLASNTTAYIQNASNIMTSVTLGRTALSINNTLVQWEIVEYIGDPGGENEIKVRQQGALTYGASSLGATTSAVSGIVTDADVAVFITGQFNPSPLTTDYNAGLSTAKWNSGSDTATFDRGEATGAVITSYAVVEFTGSNWVVQRTNDHRYTLAGQTETETITSIGSLTRAFIHAQKRVGSNLNTHANFGHEVTLTGLNQVSFRLDPAATTPASHTSVAWVIENTQTTGDVMLVTRSNGTSTAGTAPRMENVGIGTTLDDLSASSIFINNRGSGVGTTFPEPIMAVRLISPTQYELWVSNTGDNRVYRTEIVEWPTAVPRITQNLYQFYENNDQLDPTELWGTPDVGETTEVTGLDDPISSGSTTRIRMSLKVTNAALVPGVKSFKLQYAPRVSTCSGLVDEEWSDLGNIGSTTAMWRATSTSVADGTVLSTYPYVVGELNLSESDVAGTFEEENNTAVTPYLVRASEDVEYDWAIQDNNATDKTSFCFRMVESDGTPFFAYNNYPTIRTIGFGAQSQDWNWYDDANSETPTSTLAATNTAPVDIEFDNSIALRLTLREVNGAPGVNVKYRLQFSESSSFATSTFVEELGSCTNLSYWCYASSTGAVDNAIITQKKLGDADPCTGGVGDGCGTHNESGTTSSSFTHLAGAATEFSFIIKSNGARVNRVYYFRAYDSVNDAAVPLGSGESYPSLLTKGATLIFTMTGVASTTVIDGVTIDVDSTPSRIAYGSVPDDGTFVEAAHRLVVDTDGTQGHKIYMKMSGDLVTSGGSKIEQITGTNAVPLSWALGCDAGAKSCFGYHTSDDILEGPSTRFSANDTYARVSTTTPEEVSYSSQPVVGDSTDIIFRILVRDLQEAGQYVNNIQYVSVPMF